MFKVTFISLALFFLGPLAAEEVPPHIEGAQTIEAETLIDLVLEQPDLVIIDARIGSDLNEGFIEGAISLANIDTNCDSLSDAVDSFATPLVFYCNGVKCKRSFESVNIALACGYTNLHWFRGGIEEWKLKQYPIVQPN